MRNPIRRSVGASAFLAAAALAVVVPAPAIAAPRPPVEPFTSVYEAGQVCEFPLLFTSFEDGHYTVKEVTDADGNTVGYQFAGTTSTEQYTNMWTGASVTLSSTGFRQDQKFDDTGGMTVTDSGHRRIILADELGGPSFTVYVGHMVRYVTFDGPGTQEIIRFRGTSRDICAELG